MDNDRTQKTCFGTVARALLPAALIVAVATANVAFARNVGTGSSLIFRGGIGVIPVTGVAANGSVNLNVVRGVSPAGPWRIEDLRARVSADGRIFVVGHGLLLAAGNGIGTNAGASVHASLFCGPAASASEHDSDPAGVALGPDGDFMIGDSLSPPPPTPCDNPVLLIRNAGGVWFAAGIPENHPGNL